MEDWFRKLGFNGVAIRSSGLGTDGSQRTGVWNFMGFKVLGDEEKVFLGVGIVKHYSLRSLDWTIVLRDDRVLEHYNGSWGFWRWKLRHIL